MTNRSTIDLSAMDFSSLTPDQSDALKRHIICEAQRERAELIAGAFGSLFAFLKQTAARAWGALFEMPPVFPSRRA